MRFAGSVLALAVLAGPACAQRPELIAQSELRVCADPANLPYSNQSKEGFENKIAEIVGHDLGLPVAYVWFPQVVGLVRNTLGTRACDLVMGAVAGDTIMDTTNPYYHTGYMLVTRASDAIAATSVSDPAIAAKRFGVIAATPPTDLLLAHGLLPSTTSYALNTDTRVHNPARDMLVDLVDNKIDVALVWGPIADYAIAHDHMPLKAVFLQPEPGGPRLDYRIAMGVRANEPEWRRRINQAITHQRSAIDAVLHDYGIESVDVSDTAKP